MTQEPYAIEAASVSEGERRAALETLFLAQFLQRPELASLYFRWDEAAADAAARSFTGQLAAGGGLAFDALEFLKVNGDLRAPWLVRRMFDAWSEAHDVTDAGAIPIYRLEYVPTAGQERGDVTFDVDELRVHVDWTVRHAFGAPIAGFGASERTVRGAIGNVRVWLDLPPAPDIHYQA